MTEQSPPFGADDVAMTVVMTVDELQAICGALRQSEATGPEYNIASEALEREMTIRGVAMEYSEYGRRCQLCNKRGGPMFARMYFTKVQGRWRRLCKSCWEKQP